MSLKPKFKPDDIISVEDLFSSSFRVYKVKEFVRENVGIYTHSYYLLYDGKATHYRPVRQIDRIARIYTQDKTVFEKIVAAYNS